MLDTYWLNIFVDYTPAYGIFYCKTTKKHGIILILNLLNVFNVFKGPIVYYVAGTAGGFLERGPGYNFKTSTF